MHRTVEDFSSFEWPNGHAELWKVRVQKLAAKIPGWDDPKVSLVFTGTGQQLWERRYQPLGFTPQPFSDFAAIGQSAIAAAINSMQDSSSVVTFPGPDVVPETDRDAMALFAEVEAGIQRQILRFVKSWGPPVLVFDSDGAIIVPFRSFVRLAMDLYDGQVLLRELDQARNAGKEQEATRLHLAARSLFWHREEGVRHSLDTFTCNHLLTAMWLQLAERSQSGRMWHQCEGCGRLFLADHGRQRFHDDRCRYRAQYHKRADKGGSE